MTAGVAADHARITADHARRFLVRRHLLDPPRRLPPGPDSVLTAVERLGSLQFDPLAVPGARNHELVLFARIEGYARGDCERWMYGAPAERRLFEAYNKSLNILPVHELPYYRSAWARAAVRHRPGILRSHAKAARAILARIRDEGPLASTAFAESHEGSIDWHWAPTREGRALLEALFETGALGIARREGNRRYFELIERLFPPELLEQRVTPTQSVRHRLLSRYRGVGLMGARASTELVLSAAPAAERARVVAKLVREGELVAVEVEGLRGPRYVLRDELAILEETRETRERDASRPREVSFLAPLDPLLWDRELLRALFGFDYIWEVYTPAARRKHGYYVLPILFGDRLVGRIEPRVVGGAGVLEIAGLWFEAGFDATREPDFAAALARAVEAYRVFVGATRVTWPKTRVARELTRAP